MSSKNKTAEILLPLNFLLLAAFAEGAAVMSVELIAAKMLAPFFGQSLTVWSTIIAITLGGLTLGYFLGGLLSEKFPNQKALFNIFSLLAAFTAFLPFIATQTMIVCLDFGAKNGAMISCSIFLFPLMIGFGMISPMLIRLISKDISTSGKSAGMVYAVSTLGGIIFTFLVGFFLIPNFGLKVSSYWTALLLFIFPFFFFIKNKNLPQFAVIFVSVLFIFGLHKKTDIDFRKKTNSYIKISYRNDGLLGQLLVADDLKANSRSLFINNISQSFMLNQTQKSIWKYVHRIATYSSVKPARAKVLLAGMGGGLLVKELLALNFDLEVVELDKRMLDVASKYFGTEKKFNFIADDFRHFTKTANKKYDIVIVDISFGENQPSYIYTKESFSEIKNLLNPDGFFFIHFPGVLGDEKEKAVSSIGKTLEQSGLQTRLLNTNPRLQLPTELIFFSTLQSTDLSSFHYERLPESAKRFNFPLKETVYLQNINFENGIILTDDKPMMDFLHEKTVMTARKEGIEIVTKTLLKEGYTIF